MTPNQAYADVSVSPVRTRPDARPTKMMVFTGRTEEDNKPTKQMKNSMNRSQIFYSERPDSFADKTLHSASKGYNKRNSSQIGRTDLPDSFEQSIISRGRN